MAQDKGGRREDSDMEKEGILIYWFDLMWRYANFLCIVLFISFPFFRGH